MLLPVELRHEYKVYKNSVFLGLLPNVRSQFVYRQDINTASTDIDIELGEYIDTAGDALEPIETQQGEPITTENERVLTTERALEKIGSSTSGRLIANGNDIEVWEYSDSNPNGVKVFSGYQSRMRSVVGEDSSTTLTVISYGRDLDNYIYGNSAFSAQVTQANAGFSLDIGAAGQAPGGSSIGGQIINQVGQTLSGHAFTMTKISVSMACGNHILGIYPSSVNVTLRLFVGALNSNVLVDLVTATITNQYPSFATTDFILNSPVVLDAATSYYILVTVDDYAEIKYGDPGGYSGGSLVVGSNTYGPYASAGTDDLTFTLYSGTLLTDATFSAADPSQMVKDAIDGVATDVTYTGSSVDMTGLSLDYIFVTATALEIVKKARELAPADWYWYVDPATQVLTFKATAVTATHKFILGRHISQLGFESSIEDIKNVIYFTGGPTAGTNLLKRYTDTASLAVNRLGMERLTDNRILAADEPTAAALADAYMDERNSEEYRTEPLTILAATYDISTIKLGDTVAIESVGNFIDSIIFQITSLERAGTYARLTLGKLPLKSDAYVDAIRRKLDTVQTLDNPNTPS